MTVAAEARRHDAAPDIDSRCQGLALRVSEEYFAMVTRSKSLTAVLLSVLAMNEAALYDAGFMNEYW